MQSKVQSQSSVNLLEGSVLPAPEELIIQLVEEELRGPTNSRTRLQSLLVAQEPSVAIGTGVDLTAFLEGDPRWLRAKHRFDAVQNYLKNPSPVCDLSRQAKEAGVHLSTMYRWLHQQSRGDGSLSDHLDRPRIVTKSKFSDEIEEVIRSAIHDAYMRPEKITVARLSRLIRKTCTLRGLESPHVNTIRLRIKKLSMEKMVRSRFGERAAKVKFSMHGKGFPKIDGPLVLVQIDHTPVDLINVDEETREPIGRVYVTVVFDTFSRMVLGFFLSLDEPSALSVGLALLHAILPKKPWLDELGIEVDWPCQGIPTCVFVDNAMEFHGNMLRRWAENYACDLQFRLTKTPEVGGHIERFLRTLALAVHEIPGTTFSNTRERGDYKSVEHACMTMREFEGWLVRWISLYHISPHAGLGDKTPISQWEEWHRSQCAVTGMCSVGTIPDPIKLRMALLPYAERSIQQYGVRMFGDTYYHDVLRPFVYSSDPKDSLRKQRYVFRYDPRDISKIYFWEPTTQQYFQIPWRDPARRPCSLWEQRKRMVRVKEKNRATIDELAIAQHLEDLDRRKDEAKAKTLKQRRDVAKKRSHCTENVHQFLTKDVPSDHPIAVAINPSLSIRASVPAVRWNDIKPYSEVE